METELPNIKWRKKQLQDFALSEGHTVDPKATKRQLLDLINGKPAKLVKVARRRKDKINLRDYLGIDEHTAVQQANTDVDNIFATTEFVEKRTFFYTNVWLRYRSQVEQFLTTVSHELSGTADLYIRGSSAWYYWIQSTLHEDFQDYVTDKTGSPVDFLAFYPQNIDLSIFTTKSSLHNVIDNVYQQLHTLKQELEDQGHGRGKPIYCISASDNIIRETESTGCEQEYSKILRTTEPQQHELFKGYAMALCVSSVELNKYKRYAEAFCRPAVFAADSPGFFVIYLTIHIVEDHEYPLFKKHFIHVFTDSGVLNERGLLLHGSLAKRAGRERKKAKGLAVDDIRSEVLEKTVGGADLLDLITSSYHSLTQLETLNVATLGEYFAQNFKNALVEELLKLLQAYQPIEANVVEYYRAIVNAIACDIQGTPGVESGIIGGDAFGRYFDNPTSDIDIKVYAKDIIGAGKEILTTLSNHTLFLNQLNIDPPTTSVPGISFNVSPQFRLRKIPNIADGVDLYTIDMKQLFRFSYSGHVYSGVYNLALLDVTLSKKPKHLSEIIPFTTAELSDTDGHYTDYLINIASKEWLLADFNNTFSKKELLQARFIAGKVHKDVRRYRALQTLDKPVHTIRNIIDTEYISKFGKISQDPDFSNAAAVYSCAFVYTDRPRMPFNICRKKLYVDAVQGNFAAMERLLKPKVSQITEIMLGEQRKTIDAQLLALILLGVRYTCKSLNISRELGALAIFFEYPYQLDYDTIISKRVGLEYKPHFLQESFVAYYPVYISNDFGNGLLLYNTTVPVYPIPDINAMAKLFDGKSVQDIYNFIIQYIPTFGQLLSNCQPSYCKSINLLVALNAVVAGGQIAGISVDKFMNDAVRVFYFLLNPHEFQEIKQITVDIKNFLPILEKELHKKLPQYNDKIVEYMVELRKLI